MKYLPSVFPILLFVLCQTTSAQQPAEQVDSSQQKSFTQVDRTGDDAWRSFFMFVASGHDYTIRGDGFGQSTPGRARPTSFHLTLGRQGRLERLYFLEHESDLILVYEATDQKYGWGYVERFDPGTMKRKWIAPVSAFNIGPGVVEGNYVYLAAANMVAKMDLATGKFVWQHDEFQTQYSLMVESFQTPTITANRVAFYENGHRGRTIEIEKTTGKILSLPN
jgi:hypothetical protein